MRPSAPMKGVKKIGYFPWAAVERILLVKRLKKQGLSMEEVAAKLRAGVSWNASAVRGRDSEIHASEGGSKGTSMTPQKIPLHLTLDSIPLPAYLLNEDFDVIWANPEAMDKVFRRSIEDLESQGARNVFKWIFRWEVHRVVQNWKDLLGLHMSYAKATRPRDWVATAYEGISSSEREILEHIYDRAAAIPGKHIYEMHINLLTLDGGTESYRVICMHFREGMLFIYSRHGGFSLW